MSKLSHSCDVTMAQIERAAAIDAGELFRCRLCDAEQIGDPPVCPTDSIGCGVVVVAPTMRGDRS